jgi:membrane fusion protein, multidrug efflux system
MRKRLVLSFLALLLMSGLAVAIGSFDGRWGARAAPKEPAAPAVPVTAALARRQDVPVYLQGLGTVQAYNAVTIRPQVDGQLRQLAFKEGQDVRTGDLLAQIDPRQYQAALDQAIAKKGQDEALLANAKNDLRRYTGLAEKNYVARQQLDQTRAQVNQLTAAVQGDEAAVENARVQLGYTSIRSPIDGRAGIRNVDVGNILHASDPGGIVIITQVHPISLLFTLPEEELPRVLEGMNKGRLNVEASSRDGKKLLDEGMLNLVDNQIDQTTGTVRLKATMPNKSGLLWPGQFVNARLRVQTLPQVVTIPSEAVQRGPDGPFAYVVKDDGTVEARKLSLTVVSEGTAAIESGISEGEKVVTAGQYRLQPGSRVEMKMAAGDPPQNAANPK